MKYLPKKIPKSVYALLGEFIIQFSVTDFKFKDFLAAFIDDDAIGYLITSNQTFDFTRRRVKSIFSFLVEDEELKNRWSQIQTEITAISNMRNDFVHSNIDFDNVTKSQFLLTRYSENQVLNFSSREIIYTIDDLKSGISRIKKLNKSISYIFHSTFKKYKNMVYYTGKGPMF
jgi:hypothetical protein